MGPVSFEGLDAGTTRAEALRYAAVLRDAGIRVMSILEPDQDGGPFRVLVRSAQVASAARVMAAVEAGSAGSAGPAGGENPGG
ncbi:MAG: hypothetical protein AAF467_16795 [Actinomycetota bacterium]